MSGIGQITYILAEFRPQTRVIESPGMTRFNVEFMFSGTTDPKEEPRILGLAMVPGCHIVSICVDEDRIPETSLAHTAMIS